MSEIDTLIISPKYRPFNDGLSDHTYYLLKELRLAHPERKIGLVTSDNTQIIKYAARDPYIYPIMKEWDGFELIPLFRLIKKLKPQILLIQYVPQMYGRAGINYFFPLLILFIRLFYRTKIHLIAHELNHPFEKDLKTGLIFFFHMRSLFYLCLSSHKILTTTDNFVRIISKLPFCKNKTNRLSVGSNIPILNNTTVIGNEINIVIFGSLHPSRNPKAVFKSIANYLEKNPNSKIRFHIIGPVKSEILSIFHFQNINLNRHLIEKFVFHGKLEEKEVAKVFSSCHFSLNYFVDGITSRRGSAIAAIGHKLPIITNHNERSDSLFNNRKCVLIVGYGEQDFFSNIHQTFKKIETMDNLEFESLKDDCREFFANEFEWKSIIEKYINLTHS